MKVFRMSLVVVALTMVSSGAMAGVNEIGEAVRCANECVAALTGAPGCEGGIAGCDALLWKHLEAAARNEQASAPSRAAVGEWRPGIEPGWVSEVPLSPRFIFGVGNGPDMNAAFAKAAAAIAGQIRVDIDASFHIETTLQASVTEDNGRVASRSEDRTDVRDSVTTSAGGVISGIVITGTYEDLHGNTFVLASLDLEEFKRNRELAVEQMGLAFYRAAAEVVNAVVARNGIGMQDVTEWNGHLEYLKELVADGDDEENVWRKAFIDFQANIGLLLACVKAQAVDSDSAFETARANRVVFSCNGRPWIEASLRLAPVDGLAVMPELVTTDEAGRATVRIGAAWGSNVNITMEPDGIERLKALKVLWKASGRPSTVALSGQMTPGITKVVVRGAPGALGLKDALSSVVTKFWAGSVSDRNARLEMRADITFGQPISLGDKYSVPCVLRIAVYEVGTSVLVFERSVNSAAMGETVDEAQAAGITNLAAVIRRMK